MIMNAKEQARASTIASLCGQVNAYREAVAAAREVIAAMASEDCESYCGGHDDGGPCVPKKARAWLENYTKKERA